LLAAGIIWVIGDLGDIQAARQLAFVSMLIGSLWLIAGSGVARVLAWPLLFLYFLVPEGQFMVPVLMDWTADFTATAARATGIPVFREGMQLMIPAGSFEIIEACSGLKFLLASIALGFFMAGAVFRSWSRRTILLAASVLVPLIANGMRAYGIVLLGHVSNMRLVADHVLIGQVFFSVICFVVCWLAIRYSDLESLTEMPVTVPAMELQPAYGAGPVLIATVVPVALSSLALILAPTLEARLAGRPAGPAPGLPDTVSDLPGEAPPPGDWQPQFSGATREISRRFGDVDAYALIYTEESEGAELVNERNELFDRTQWQRIRAQRGIRHSSGLRFNQLEIRSTDGARLVRYWYLLGTDAVPQPGVAKLRALSALLDSTRSSGSLIALSVTIDGSIEVAERKLDRFITAFCSSELPAGSVSPCGS
jgi:EpsI family protein